MSGEFRFVFFTKAYEETLAFYREGLALPIVGGWDRGPNDRGTLFGAASGIIEVIYSEDQPPEPSQNSLVLYEVQDIDNLYQRLLEKGLPIEQEITDRPWGHRDFKLVDPNGIKLGIFSKTG